MVMVVVTVITIIPKGCVESMPLKIIFRSFQLSKITKSEKSGGGRLASFAMDAAMAGGSAGAVAGNAAAALGATSTAAIGVLAAETIGVGAACI